MLKFSGTHDNQMINRIKEIHAEAMEKVTMAQDLVIFVKLNSRMRSVGGKARLKANCVGQIELNYRLHRDNPDQIITTYLHELAHIITRQRHGYSSQVKSHGYQWQRAMIELGQNPDRCHTMDVSAYKNKTVKYEYRCACTTYQLSKIRHNKILKGAGYSCRKCKRKLVR